MSIFNGLKIKKGVLIKCSKRKRTVEIPEDVKSIAPKAFENCIKLKNVIINAKITELPGHAFYNCTNLESVALPLTLKSIGSSAFSKCVSLKKFELPVNVTNMGMSVFSGCSSLNSIIIPDKTTKIYPFSFCDCTSLEEVKLHDNLEAIEQFAFSGCTSLKSITIPKKVSVIKEGVFEDCQSLTDTGMHGNITKIEEKAYRGCTSLKKVSIPERVRSMNASVFSGCTSLESLSLSEDIIITGARSYYNPRISLYDSHMAILQSLKKHINGRVNLIFTVNKPEFYIKNKTLVKYKGSCSYRTVYIPSGVERIASEAFKENNYIAHIIIPESVKIIDKKAFYNNNLEKVSFLGCPNFKGVFIGCSKLEDVFIPYGNNKSDYDVSTVEPDDCFSNPGNFSAIYLDPNEYWSEAQLSSARVARMEEINRKYRKMNYKGNPILEDEYYSALNELDSWVPPIPDDVYVMIDKANETAKVLSELYESKKRREVRFSYVPRETYDRYKNIKVTSLKDGVYDSESRFIRNLD